uniref:Deoxyribonuclease II n=1 Tax=Ditylenchus dipsaci TaxID=166011 RepID=A0A915D8X4_9BILA
MQILEWKQCGLVFRLQTSTFLYADSTTNAWVMSQQSIGSESSAIGMTIKQIFQSSKQNDFYALYNDEHPNNKTDSGRGHMKGSLLFDDFDGFWLIHSVPNFPSTATGSYFYLILVFQQLSIQNINENLV